MLVAGEVQACMSNTSCEYMLVACANNISALAVLNLLSDMINTLFRIFHLVDKHPSVGSCHHGMARPLGYGWNGG